MDKAKSNIKKGTTNRVNVAAVLVQYFMGGVIRALQKRRIRKAIVPKAVCGTNKYVPHQGAKEMERRRRRLETSETCEEFNRAMRE